MDFSKKAILVTGSTRGIGRAVVEKLLSAGAVVGVHGRNMAEVEKTCSELSKDKDRTVPIAADFSDPQSAAGIVKTFFEACGRIDGLVNNAGGGKAVAFRGLTSERWRATMRINLEAAMLASQEAYTHMRKARNGSIVNIASMAAHGPGKWMGADYAASKAGLVSLTQSLAFEAGRFGIRVNAVSPGMIETDMTEALTEEMKSALNIPLGRLGRPEEVAHATAFLLSDESRYITGQAIHVNGGLFM